MNAKSAPGKLGQQGLAPAPAEGRFTNSGVFREGGGHCACPFHPHPLGDGTKIFVFILFFFCIYLPFLVNKDFQICDVNNMLNFEHL